MERAALWVFALTLASIVYGYVGFPALVALVGTLRRREVRRAPVTPSVSLIIAAYNEEDAIGARLENALASDYPADALEIIVASDGSNDRTDAIVASFASRGVRLLALPRQGKLGVLGAAVAAARGEVLVFSDANIHMQPDALRMLARNFADPEVGGVAGNCLCRMPDDGESSAKGEGLYWRYDTWLKEMESHTGSIVSAHGALYAIRRSLYRQPAEMAVTDDFAISTTVIEQGARLVFDRDALASELVIAKADREFRRKVRLMTRAWRSVSLRRALLNPFRTGFYAVVLFSHKVLRRLLPVSLLLLFAATAVLATSLPPFRWLFALELVFVLLAAVGMVLRRSPAGAPRVVALPFYFCLANLAALVAFVRFLRGDRVTLWQPQRHPASVAQA